MCNELCWHAVEILGTYYLYRPLECAFYEFTSDLSSIPLFPSI